MSTSQPKFVDAQFYAVVTPKWSSWQKEDGRPVLVGAKVDRITQSRPDTVRGGGIVTRLTLRIDSGALLPLQPQAVIHIVPGQAEVIEAVATDPRDGEAE